MMRLTLGDVCVKESSNIAQKDLIDKNGIYPIYGASGYIKKVNFYHQDKDYIAVVKDGAGIGRTMLLPAYSSVIGTMQYLLPKAEKDIDIRYLYHAITYMNLAKYFNGATIPHIYFKDYKKESINVPDITKQRYIVRQLDKIDELIEARKKQLIKLEQIGKSRFIEMFGVYPENLKRWELGTIRDIVTDVRYGSSRPAVDGGKYPYIRMNNITYGGELDLSDIKYIDVPDNELDKCTVRRGDVLFNRTNSKELVGKTCVYDQDEVMVLAGFVIRIRVKDCILPEFLSTFLNTDFSKQMLMGMCKTAIGQANINAQELQNIGIYLPPVELQRQFVQFKKETDKSKLLIEKSLNKLHVIKLN